MPDQSSKDVAFDARGVQVAMRALGESRTRLMTAFRFLDRALWRMPMLPDDIESMLATDGIFLRFHPGRVLKTYRRSPDEAVRAYLHSVLHCVFHHPFHTVRKERALWGLACDICVEGVALQLIGERFGTEQDKAIRRFVERLEREGCAMVPSQVYRALLLAKQEPEEHAWLAPYAAEPDMWGQLFARDSHELWDLVVPTESNGEGDSDKTDQPQTSGQEGNGQGTPDGESQDGDAGGQGESSNDGDAQADSEESDQASDGASEGGQPPEATRPQAAAESTNLVSSDMEAVEQAQQDWSNISQQIETEMQDYARNHGFGAGLLEDNLKLANRSSIDYDDFLRRFCSLNEQIKTNDDEFDYVFYTYGLSHYGNMPLIEPLEYQEENSLREFVIAVDTSGSCAGELTQTFLTRTFEILSEARVADTCVNIHIVQCDAAVQSDTVIRSKDELRNLADNLVVRGKGGTDFRPVFDYVNRLVEDGEFSDLRGLIYFTDGFGVFPKAPPDYDVAFVFVEDEGKDRRVPPWACKVVMSQDEIAQLDPENEIL